MRKRYCSQKKKNRVFDRIPDAIYLTIVSVCQLCGVSVKYIHNSPNPNTAYLSGIGSEVCGLQSDEQMEIKCDLIRSIANNMRFHFRCSSLGNKALIKAD